MVVARFNMSFSDKQRVLGYPANKGWWNLTLTHSDASWPIQLKLEFQKCKFLQFSMLCQVVSIYLPPNLRIWDHTFVPWKIRWSKSEALQGFQLKMQVEGMDKIITSKLHWRYNCSILNCCCFCFLTNSFICQHQTMPLGPDEETRENSLGCSRWHHKTPWWVKSLSIGKVTFKYIWTNHLSKNNKKCALMGTKTSNDKKKVTT